MPTPSKFTAENREKILQALQVGASRRTAAHIAGVDEAQVRRWFKRGQDATEGRYREFYEAVQKAEASPRMRALGIIYKEMPDNPGLAWKYIERREPGYELPAPAVPAVASPVVINLSLTGGEPTVPPWLDAEVIDAKEIAALSDGNGDTASAT